MTAEPQDILYQTEFPCHKLNLTNMARRRLDECFTDHPDVSYFQSALNTLKNSKNQNLNF